MFEAVYVSLMAFCILGLGPCRLRYIDSILSGLRV